MKISAKALGISTASAVGVGGATYGTVNLVNEGVRRSNLQQADTKSEQINSFWEKDGFKALNSGSEDKKGQLVYWGKVWADGGDRKNEQDYNTYDKTKGEQKLGKRVNEGYKNVPGLDLEEITTISKNNKYPKGGEKYKEICLTGYRKGRGNEESDVQAQGGHFCLYSDDEDQKAKIDTKFKTHPTKDPGEVFWEVKKEEKEISV